jgi:hypothetical protein
MFSMMNPIGHRRGSGAKGIPDSASCKAGKGSVAFAAELFSFGAALAISSVTLT